MRSTFQSSDSVGLSHTQCFFFDLFESSETCVENTSCSGTIFHDSDCRMKNVIANSCNFLGARACKFYRRHRLWNFLRATWNDFDTEFSDLELDLVRNRDKVESL